MVQKIILVTGGSGLVGQAMQKVIKEEEPLDEEWIFLSSKDADLMDGDSTNELFVKYAPTHVVHLAAVVGGVYRHLKNNLNDMRSNMTINMNILDACHNYGVSKVVSCMSTSIFPDNSSYPVDETKIHHGPPHASICGYAYAKRMLDVANHLYSADYGSNFTGVIPSNVYGPNDTFSIEEGNVLPALIHKCYLAQLGNEPFVIGGTGSPRRQFIFSEDLARLIVWTLREYREIDPILLCVAEEEETTIKELAEMIAEAFDFKGEILFDTTRSDGQFKRTTSNNKLRSYLPDYKFKSIREGIKETVEWFKVNYPDIKTSY